MLNRFTAVLALTFLLFVIPENPEQLRVGRVSATAHDDGVTFRADDARITLSLEGPDVRTISGAQGQLVLDRGTMTEYLDTREKGRPGSPWMWTQ